MKRSVYFAALGILLFSASLNAQTEHKDSLSANKAFYKNEMGFDMLFFLNVMRNQFEITNTTQLLINYQRWFSPKNAIRVLWGIGFYNNEVQQDTFPALTGKNSNNLFKLGFQREQRLSKKWLFYYGTDALFEYDNSSSQKGTFYAGIVTTIEKNMYYGPSPFMGIRFEINPRISFSTETNVNMLFYTKRITTDNNLHPEFFTSSDTKGFGIEYLIPQTLFMKVKF